MRWCSGFHSSNMREKGPGEVTSVEAAGARPILCRIHSCWTHVSTGGACESEYEQSHPGGKPWGRSRSPQHHQRVPGGNVVDCYQPPMEKPGRGKAGEDGMAPGGVLE